MDNEYLHVSATAANTKDLITNLLSRHTKATQFQANLGFIYITDQVVNDFYLVMQELHTHFNVEHWVGTVGVGICCTGAEYYDEHAIVILLAKNLGHELLEVSDDISTIGQANIPAKIAPNQTSLAVIHGNPAQENLMKNFQWLIEQMPSTYFVGGLSSSTINPPQVLNQVVNTSFSGVYFADSSQTVVAHTQGCEPIGPSYVITKAQGNVVIELNHRPALDVMKEAVGEVLARDLQQIAGYIFAGFPIEHADTNDYLVRNIVGFDLDQSSIMVGDYVNETSSMMFCRRDGNSAIIDMQRMLEDIKSRLVKPAKAALYYSCLARGRNQFGDDSEELKLIEKHLGEIPLVGFFANGEILHQRLYGYTGVLTVFI